MLAVGQPLHAFDAAKIRGGRLIARRARAGEHIVTLDGIDRALRPDNLVIADTERALVIAGIFGAIDAEVDEATTDLVLEAATFNGPNIMRTSKEVGWRSEASTRFEKGLDPWYVPLGLAMASRLFHELCGGAVAPGTVDVWGQRPPAPPRLHYRPSLSDGCSACRSRRPSRPTSCAASSARSRRRPATRRPPKPTSPSRRRRFAATSSAPSTWSKRSAASTASRTCPRRCRCARDAIGAADRRPAGAPAPGRRADRGRARRGRRPTRSSAADAARAARPGRRRPPRRAHRPRQPHERRAGRHAHARCCPGLLAAVAANLARQAERVGRLRAGPGLSAAARRTTPAPAPGPKDTCQPWPVDEPETLGIAPVRPGRPPRAGRRAPRATDFFTIKGCVERLLAGLADRRGSLRASRPSRTCTPASRPTCCSARARRARSACCVPTSPRATASRTTTVYVAELAVAPLAARGLAIGLFEDLLTFPPASQDLAVVLDADVPAAEVARRRAPGRRQAAARGRRVRRL